MILDTESQFSDAQVVTADAYGTNTMDLLNGDGDIGNGEDIQVEFGFPVAMATGTSIDFLLVDSANANLSSHNVLASSGAILTANMATDDKVRVKLPAGSNTERYFGVRYDCTGSAFDGGGAIDANVISPGPAQGSEVYLGKV